MLYNESVIDIELEESEQDWISATSSYFSSYPMGKTCFHFTQPKTQTCRVSYPDKV